MFKYRASGSATLRHVTVQVYVGERGVGLSHSGTLVFAPKEYLAFRRHQSVNVPRGEVEIEESRTVGDIMRRLIAEGA